MSDSVPQKKGLAFHWKILIALALAVITGWLLPHQIGSVHPSEIFAFVGDLFLRALKMLVTPLIVCAVISALGKMEGGEDFARLGLKTIGFYAITTLMAVVIGLFLVNVIQPGNVSEETSRTMIEMASQHAETKKTAMEERGLGDIVDILRRMIPENIVAAGADNREMLALIFFSLLFGFFITRLPEDRRIRYSLWWEDGYEVMIRITQWVIRFTPYGVFALVTATVAKTGIATFVPLAKFFFTVLLALVLHTFVALFLLMRSFGISPLKHLRAHIPALLTAFSTASSAATLPLTLECSQVNAGISKRVSGFTLPLGATINMNGTALYECVVVIFASQIYGQHLSLASQVMAVLLALMTSVGVAGIPSASMVAIIIILGAVGLPAEAFFLVVAVDRVLDMCRTAVNIYGDAVCAAIIARMEGEAVPKIAA